VSVNTTEKDLTFRKVDVLVVGSGTAGVAAAVCSGRGGERTLLVERYGRLGGAATTNLVCTLFGGVESDFVREFEQRCEKVGRNWELTDLICAEMLQEAGVEILLHTWAFEAVMQGRRVVGVRALSKQGMLELRAKVVVDATGDGDIAFSAGAAFEIGRERDGLLQPMSVMYCLGGVDKERALLCGSEEAARKATVPEGTWHDVVHRGGAAGELPENITVIRVYESPLPGQRLINATQVNYVDGTRVEDLTRAELEGRRQAVTVTEFLRRHAPGYEQCFISRMPAAVGVRETRRFLGREYLTQEDLLSGRKWSTAIAREAFFPIDIHNPTGGGQAEKTARKVRHYDIPYGCVVPREVNGLLLAGRTISGSHEAHASYRNQRITMAVGAAVGTAAAIAARREIEPRDVPAREIQKRLNIKPDASAKA
jgi:hypothetical protein